jgi:hypothetical protein
LHYGDGGDTERNESLGEAGQGFIFSGYAMKKFFTPASAAFLALWIFLILFGRVNLFRDPGTFWHTVFGQQILTSHHLPTADAYSFTFFGHRWLDSEWLMECLMAFIYGLFGFDGLLFATAAALAGLYAWIMSRLWRSGLSMPLAILMLVLVFGASSQNFHVRPDILSLIFLAVTFALLCDYEAGRLKLRGLFWLWPLFIIWSNGHGAVLGGLGTLGLTLGGWTLAYFFHQDSPVKGPKDLLTLFGLLLGCILTLFLTPYGPGLPKALITIVTSPVIPQVIQEHASIFREFGKNWPIAVLGLFYLACFLGTLPRRPRVTWLLPLVWLVLACSRVRNAPLFALTAALALPEFFPYVRWARWLSERGSVIFRRRADRPAPRPLSLKPWLVPATTVLLTVAVSLASLHFTGHGLTRFDRRHWPVDLLPELTRYAASHPAGTPIMNDMLFGGYLIFYTPRLHIFIDDRCDLYGDQFLLQYVRAQSAFFDGWIQRSGARAALTEPGSAMDNYFKHQSGWRLEKRTAAADWYLKAAG